MQDKPCHKAQTHAVTEVPSEEKGYEIVGHGWKGNAISVKNKNKNQDHQEVGFSQQVSGPIFFP